MPIVTTAHYRRSARAILVPKALRLREWSVQQLAANSQGVILTNDEDYAQLTRMLGSGSPAPQVRLIPIGSNIAPAPPQDLNRRPGARRPEVQPRISSSDTGFLNRSKGVETPRRRRR